MTGSREYNHCKRGLIEGSLKGVALWGSMGVYHDYRRRLDYKVFTRPLLPWPTSGIGQLASVHD